MEIICFGISEGIDLATSVVPPRERAYEMARLFRKSNEPMPPLSPTQPPYPIQSLSSSRQSIIISLSQRPSFSVKCRKSWVDLSYSNSPSPIVPIQSLESALQSEEMPVFGFLGRLISILAP